ncbi:GNAT family N-acetyltransferase [Pseudoroseomonas deserti]|uniref:GNAT family N-acetyltransferase n=1 Tax=Teichococcus deserti TaxID=1817963 RepID=A0A1V2GW65_9PROT|nr:GNAT family N-acetyltransferase [Pseudoroseomonas deserti]ONG47364.1 GNAT family N-acetyltransferase [Pseudoroseomonas deserti]
MRIRAALEADAAAISAVVVAALRQSNARDYPPAVIEAVAEAFAPEAVRGQIARRRVFLAEVEGVVVGTAALEGDVVRSVFVAPGRQGQGIGRALMAMLEDTARAGGETALRVPASVTAEGFYARLGYARQREVVQGEERTIVMARELPP